MVAKKRKVSAQANKPVHLPAPKQVEKHAGFIEYFLIISGIILFVAIIVLVATGGFSSSKNNNSGIMHYDLPASQQAVSSTVSPPTPIPETNQTPEIAILQPIINILPLAVFAVLAVMAINIIIILLFSRGERGGL